MGNFFGQGRMLSVLGAWCGQNSPAKGFQGLIKLFCFFIFVFLTTLELSICFLGKEA